MKGKEKEEKIELIKEILLRHDIKMDIHGCGCCGSPNVTFEYKGEKIIDDQDECRLYMIEEDPFE